MVDLLSGVMPRIIVVRGMDLPEAICASCYMWEDMCRCSTFGNAMGKVIEEVLLLCQLRSLGMLQKRFLHFVREGKAYVIMNSVINGGEQWARHYDSAVHELMHYKVEGIEISQAAGIERVRRFEDFWRYVVQAKVDIVQLVFDDALGFDFQVSGDLGGHEPYAGYERRLDIEVFSRANSRMVGNLAKTLREEECVGV